MSSYLSVFCSGYFYGELYYNGHTLDSLSHVISYVHMHPNTCLGLVF